MYDELSNKFFEILGATNAELYGTTSLQEIKQSFDNENEIYQYKFYRYENFKLFECQFGEAASTLEYKKDNLFIFSYAPEDNRIFYVAKIISDN